MAMCIHDAHVLEVEQPVGIDGQVDVVAPRAAQVRGERRQMIDAFRVAEHEDRHPLTEAHAARHPKRSRQPGVARRGTRGMLYALTLGARWNRRSITTRTG